VVGAGAFVLASALGLWSCVTMALRGEGTPLPAETARRLVVAGPYRWVRNPMAVAGGLQTATVGLVTGSWLVIVIAVVGALAWHTLIRPAEEADLASRFGDPYERYRSAVRCWIPTRPPDTWTV
jgi:protein-S-isoprenylcysteine O-methyltransferase Ste14